MYHTMEIHSANKSVLLFQLSQEKKTFLKNFKNPCWYEPSGKNQSSSSSVQNKILRCLPYFHIFGVCKTGTTDLFFRLIQHPQILPNAGVLGKETWFWSWRRYGESMYAAIITCPLFYTIHVQNCNINLTRSYVVTYTLVIIDNFDVLVVQIPTDIQK